LCPVTLAGFLGPQTREEQCDLDFFWLGGWPGYLLCFCFHWPAVVEFGPLMITAEWLRTRPRCGYSLRQQLAVGQLQWPQFARGRGCYFGGFVVINLWNKLWDFASNSAYSFLFFSAWLPWRLTAGAVIC